MEGERDQADRQIAFLDEPRQLPLVLQVQREGLPVGVPGKHRLGLSNGPAGHDDLVFPVQQVPHQGLGHQPRSQDQNSFHRLLHLGDKAAPGN
jgi:hypothetical protein